MRTVIKNATVIDGKGRVLERADVAFGDRIEEVNAKGLRTTTNSEDRVIDLDGAIVMPGLMNLHVHIQRRHVHRQVSQFHEGTPKIEAQAEEVRFAWAIQNAWAELREGITTFRDTGSGNALANKVRWAFASGVLRGPRVVSSGEAIAMTGGHGTHYKNLASLEADGVTGVQRAVRAQLAGGADWIKLMASSGLAGMPVEDPRWPEFTVEEMAAGVQAAHSRSARVCAHAFFPEAIQNAVRAGVDCIEHGQIIDEETAALMAKAGASYVPTTSGQTELERRERLFGSPEVADIMASSVVDPHRESIATAFEAGVRIGTGTDTMGQIVDEIKLLHDAGIPVMDCLEAATSISAEILGMDDEVGSIEVGQRADLIVLPGNPLDDLEELRRVRDVFVNGHQVTTAWLVGSIDEAMLQPTLDPSRPLFRRKSRVVPVS